MVARPPPFVADPLRTRTDASWAPYVLATPLALLDDHAHLERKAAANALELLQRWPGPDPGPPEAWTRALSAIARDETDHLRDVLALLSRRGGGISRVHGNPYASALRALVRTGTGPDEVVDRLLVSALIEARSCERFERLAEAAQGDLLGLYRRLAHAERGHHRTFLDLARMVPGADRVDARWDELLDEEARVIARQPAGPRLHGGVPAP
jgi:tRNA-(ms[2]io[6]A)-hydroxylase